jgi:hypothetical protein
MASTAMDYGGEWCATRPPRALMLWLELPLEGGGETTGASAWWRGGGRVDENNKEAAARRRFS